MQNSVEKQLVINSFPVPKDIQEYMKEFLFLDENQSRILKNRKDVITSLKNELFYDILRDHWGIWTSTIQIQGVNCEFCGHFLQVNINVPECCLCKCVF